MTIAVIVLLISTLAIANIASRNAQSAERAIHQNAKAHVEQYTQEARRQIKQECMVAPRPERDRCAQAIQDRAREQQRREYEVEAQRNSAVWNEAMGEAAIQGLPFAAMTVILIFAAFLLQAHANRHAVEAFGQAREDAQSAASAAEKGVRAANRTAAAAAKQIKISEDTAYRELRAYIGLRTSITRISSGLIKGRIMVKNAGQTPARFKLYIGTWIGPFPLPALPPDAPAPNLFEQHNPFVNARGFESIDWFHPTHNHGTADEIDAWVANPTGKLLYIFGRVEFTDLMKRTNRILTFCYRNHGQPKLHEGLETIPLPWGNDYEERDL